MNDYFDELERDLRAAVRREAHLPWYVRLARRGQHVGQRPLLVMLTVLVLGGSATAAVLSLSKSRPLSGSLPAGFLSVHTTGKTQYRVSLFPYLSVGWSGWCSSVNFAIDSRPQATSYGCAPTEVADPVVLTNNEFGDQGGTYQYAIFSDRVAEVRYADGVRIKPIGDPRLPSWVRAAVRVYTPREAAKAGGGRLFIRSELLEANGHQVPEHPILSANAVEHLPLAALNPSDPANLPCAVHARATPGLLALSQTVTTPVPWPRHAPGGFLACANASYKLGATNLGVAVLVNAVDPEQSADLLPGLSRDPSHPGIFLGNELGTIGYPAGSGVFSSNPTSRAFDSVGPHKRGPLEEHNSRDHNISARRAGRGWLIAEGGTPDQRAALLNALQTEA
ncbi:MAG TPA: hypothetical protein VIJ39_08370 [Solirubrobacteraceae bacterium]